MQKQALPYRLFLLSTLLLLILACSLPGAASSPGPVNPTPVAAQNSPEPTSLRSAPTRTSRVPIAGITPPDAPSLTPDVKSAEPQPLTASDTPMLTALPVLPDFEKTVKFGGGGGGGLAYVGYCFAYQTTHQLPDSFVYGSSATVSSEYTERMGTLCLRGLQPDLPFSVRLVSPDGSQTLSANFTSSAGQIFMQGSAEPVGSLNQDPNVKGLWLDSISIYWPVGLPLGDWQMLVDGQAMQAQGTLTALQGDPEWKIDRQRELAAVDPGANPGQLLPLNIHHTLKTDGSQQLRARGYGYSPGAQVYIVAYQAQSFGRWEFAHASSALADARGQVNASLPGPFWNGLDYLLVGTEDPALLRPGEDGQLQYANPGLGYEKFQLEAGLACPGAPPQRLKRGSAAVVCTRRDAVVMRSAPNRAGQVLRQLAVGTQLGVMGGPSCADGWSWWFVTLGFEDAAQTGWMSEGGDATDAYFLCPAP